MVFQIHLVYIKFMSPGNADIITKIITHLLNYLNLAFA